MAISRKTQKDIGNYEAKLMGPFTTRQCICVGVGIIPAFFICYSLFSAGADAFTILIGAVIFMGPACFMAFVRPYGMKPEDFIRDYYIYHLMAPKIRPYKTETLDDILEKEARTEQNNTKKTKTIHKKDKDYPDYL